jgi:hypothetical protein
MQAHAPSFVSKHTPASVNQLQERPGSAPRSKPGVQTPRSCCGSVTVVPDEESDFWPLSEPAELPAGVLVPEPPDPGSS